MKPKLGDFGASKLLDTINTGASIVGTLFYMAPEIIEGFGTDALAADVYRYLKTSLQ